MGGILLLIGSVMVALAIGWSIGFRDGIAQNRQAIDRLLAPWTGTERRRSTDGTST